MIINTRDGYNDWAKSYDLVINKTRDLEEKAIREVLGSGMFKNILEIGCGTGKNTIWLAGKSERLVAADFSEEMLNKARMKINAGNVDFIHADITSEWAFDKVNLITCSLVLEHIKDIFFIFKQAASILEKEGKFYICELHPYKQLQGSRARFEKDGAIFQLEYFVHHISDYFIASKQYNFICENLKEWFDEEDRYQTPRLVSFLFTKT